MMRHIFDSRMKKQTDRSAACIQREWIIRRIEVPDAFSDHSSQQFMETCVRFCHLLILHLPFNPIRICVSITSLSLSHSFSLFRYFLRFSIQDYHLRFTVLSVFIPVFILIKFFQGYYKDIKLVLEPKKVLNTISCHF